ncbi:MAG: PEP-CTERM sorting domain-containing protein [Fimbriimonadales bacterium]
MKSVFTVLLLGLNNVASATLVDSFQPFNHSQDITFGGANEGGHSFVTAFRGDILGGERDVELSQLDNTSPPGPLFMARYEEFRGPFYRVGGIGNGAPGSSSPGHVLLQYDGSGDEDGNEGYDHHLSNFGSGMPLFNATDGGIRIWYRQLVTSDVIRTTLTLRRLGVALESNTKGLGGFGADLHFDSFEFSPDNLGIADSLTVDIYSNLTGPNSDQTLELDHIDTILPEPSSLAALGLGGMMLGLGMRKRRRS